MTIANYSQALDEHARILSSLSPMSSTNKMIRTSVVLGPMLHQVGDDSFDKMTNSVMRKTGETNRIKASALAMDKIFGEGYFDLELSSYIAAELATLRRAQTIFCSQEIVEEIQEAQQTMLDTIILPQDVFVPDGAIFLEKPYKYSVITRTPDAETWQMEEFAVNTLVFTNTSDRINNGGIAIELYGHWRAVHMFNAGPKPSSGDTPFCSYIHDPNTGLTTYVPMDETAPQEEIETMRSYEKYFSRIFKDKAVGTPMLLDTTFFQYGETDTEYDEEVLELKRFLLAFFRLTYEYLEVDSTRPERSFQKRAKRSGINIPSDGYVTVMTLRRKLYTGESESDKQNSPGYAFRVRGHWKKQYLPSRKLPVGDPGAYRHLYIKDYIKGRGVVVRSKRVVKVGD